ncbi:MAG: hypothetical protein CMM77_00405 [Rhodospirillaceae bacterium]|nr:hypothetical protein [Rhodospirillaceae bacterium]
MECQVRCLIQRRNSWIIRHLEGTDCREMTRLFIALILAISVFATEVSASEPVPYRPLPAGTVVTYDNWAFEVIEQDGFVTINKGWEQSAHDVTYYREYGGLQRFGSNALTKTPAGPDTSEFSSKVRNSGAAAIRGLFPLEVGKQIQYEVADNLIPSSTGIGSTFFRTWQVKIEVTGKAYLRAKSTQETYETFVIKRTSVAKALASNSGFGYAAELTAQHIVDTLWFHAPAGIIVKAKRTWVSGDPREFGDVSDGNYTLRKVKFPNGSANTLQPTDSYGALAYAPPSSYPQASTPPAGTEVPDASSGYPADYAAWSKVKDSNDPKAMAWFIQQFPNSAFAEIARIRLEGLSGDQNGSLALGADDLAYLKKSVRFGAYHALVIGNNGYRHLSKLRTAVNDARQVARVLQDHYGFKVRLLIDATRADVVNALDEYAERLNKTDNLLIYYAGHGWLSKNADRGYWLPVDAQPNRRLSWISNATVTDSLRLIRAKHIMVVADSCFSGKLTRGATVRLQSGSPRDYYARIAGKQARVALVSGGLEPVADNGGGGHSPFAKAFIQALAENRGVLDGTQLFARIRRPVMTAAKQTPEYADIQGAGHDGGDFLFVAK